MFTVLMVLGKYIFTLTTPLDASNNPAIRAEDDPGTARSKQTTFKRKKVKSNDWKKSQGSEKCVTGGRKLYVVQESNSGRKTDCSKSNMSRYFVTVFFLVL